MVRSTLRPFTQLTNRPPGSPSTDYVTRPRGSNFILILKLQMVIECASRGRLTFIRKAPGLQIVTRPRAPYFCNADCGENLGNCGRYMSELEHSKKISTAGLASLT